MYQKHPFDLLWEEIKFLTSSDFIWSHNPKFGFTFIVISRLYTRMWTWQVTWMRERLVQFVATSNIFIIHKVNRCYNTVEKLFCPLCLPLLASSEVKRQEASRSFNLKQIKPSVCDKMMILSFSIWQKENKNKQACTRRLSQNIMSR